MVDYTAMWIHQRTGKNTAISFRAGAVVFVLLLIGGTVSELSPQVRLTLGVIAVLLAGVWLLNRNITVTKDERAGRREYERLAAKERYEQVRAAEAEAEADRVADLQRLRTKYRSGPD